MKLCSESLESWTSPHVELLCQASTAASVLSWVFRNWKAPLSGWDQVTDSQLENIDSRAWRRSRDVFALCLRSLCTCCVKLCPVSSTASAWVWAKNLTIYISEFILIPLPTAVSCSSGSHTCQRHNVASATSDCHFPSPQFALPSLCYKLILVPGLQRVGFQNIAVFFLACLYWFWSAFLFHSVVRGLHLIVNHLCLHCWA